VRSKKPLSVGKPTFVIFIALLLASAVVTSQAEAQTYKFKVLHTFHGKDGSFPTGTLTRDSAGNLYGTTSGGGTGGCDGYGCGTVFKMNKRGKEYWLYSFKGTNEINPAAGVLRDASGNLYGTTEFGGTITAACGGVQAGGCGTVFKVDKAGRGSVLYKFKGTPDGFNPQALLVNDPLGNLYGTTYLGGASGVGAVFKLDASGKEIKLHSFAGPPEGGGDGAFSYEGPIRDARGNLYGVTSRGGTYGAGAVYELNAAGVETLLYSFSGGSDGSDPDSVLLLDSKGNLYGTTAAGGNSECGGAGCGVVFELSPQTGGGWSETVLYAFCSFSDCVDGEEPVGGPLARDPAGNIYGTTIFGGRYRNCNGDACGVVFKLDPTGKETVLHSFTGGADGAFPVAGLTMDSSGNLYGTAWQGGAQCFTSYTCGVVFKITP
jgi:uncharacterized repeat protein (TIGR03803 family)